MASFGDLFGFTKAGNQGDYGGQKPIRFSDTPYGPVHMGATKQFLAREGTGYAPEVMDANRSAWAQLAKNQFRDSSAQTIARASAGGLGRSSLVPAQLSQQGEDLADRLGARGAELERQSQEAEIGSQRLGYQGSLAGGQAEVASQNALANFEKAEFNRQQNFRAAQEAQQLAGLGRTANMGMAVLGGGIGAGLGAGVEGVGALQGALTGMQMGGGLMSDPVSGAANAAKTMGIGGYKPTGLFGSGFETDKMSAIIPTMTEELFNSSFQSYLSGGDPEFNTIEEALRFQQWVTNPQNAAMVNLGRQLYGKKGGE